MRPMPLAARSVNQRLPSGPLTMRPGLLPDGTSYSVILPAGVIFPILATSYNVNQSSLPGPWVMPVGLLAGVGIANSVISPLGVMRPILFAFAAVSVNQRLPSLPVVIASGPLLGVGTSKL